MSKKNKLSTRRNAHAFDLEREKKHADAVKKKQEKKAAKAAKGGVVKKKSKGIRVRKGVKIKGIKVTDSDSKKKVLQLLKAEEAMRHMEVEDTAPKKKSKKVKVSVDAMEA